MATLSTRLRWQVLQRDSFKCQYCGRRAPDVELEVDHIQPRAGGGSDSLENLQAACKDCNRSKRAALLPGVQDLDEQLPTLSMTGRWFFHFSPEGYMERQGIVEQDGSDYAEVRYVAAVGMEASTHMVPKADMATSRWRFYTSEEDMERDWKYGGLEAAWRRRYGVSA